MSLAELLLQVGVDIDNIDNDAKTILYKTLYLNNVDNDIIEHPMSMELDEDGDLQISF